MKFLMKLFSKSGFLLLNAFPILVYSQNFPSLNAHQRTDSGTKIAHGGDFTPRSADFRTFPFYIGVSPLLHQIKSLLNIKQS